MAFDSRMVDSGSLSVTFAHLPLLPLYWFQTTTYRMVYYYDGRSFETIVQVLRVIRDDVDFTLCDSDMDAMIRENGGVYVDGQEFRTCLSLKRYSNVAYREKREEIVDWIMSEVRDAVKQSVFPIRIPFTYNLLESSDD